jgi:predicted transcriptional regulator
MNAVGRDDGVERILGPLEAEVVREMWAVDRPVTVRELVERLNGVRSKPLAYTTVMTVMSRLEGKGVLRRRREGRGYIYEATAEDAAGIAVREVMRSFGEDALAQFAAVAQADPALLRRLERLLAEER